ncbi:MAG: rhodanese-like domain-containing protein [Polyangiales bacterium]
MQSSPARRRILTLWLCLAVSCGDDAESTTLDASVTQDAASVVPALDASVLDATQLDANVVDASAPGAARGPHTLAVRAAASTDDNEAGLIGSKRLAIWLADWQASRPAAITGDLIVLQLNALPGGDPYAQGEGAVRVHAAAELVDLVGPRSNGLAALGSVPQHGLRVDLLLRKYGIHPSRDLVVLAAGQLTTQALDTLARAWLALRYWGVPHASLALLGEPLALPRRGPSGTTPPVDGTERVSDLQAEHFALYADLGAVREAVGQDTLIDVRDAAQYAGDELGTSARDNSCTRGVPRCTPLFAGHIAGAVSLPWTSLVDAHGLRPRDELDLALRNAGVDPTRSAIVYDGDDQGAAIVSFALLAVVGVPARWYGGSYLEWGSLNAAHPDPALRVLDPASPYRTDVPALTAKLQRWAAPEQGVRPLVLNPNVRALDRVLREDRDYKREPTALPPPGQGDNPCIL